MVAELSEQDTLGYVVLKELLTAPPPYDDFLLYEPNNPESLRPQKRHQTHRTTTATQQRAKVTSCQPLPPALQCK